MTWQCKFPTKQMLAASIVIVGCQRLEAFTSSHKAGLIADFDKWEPKRLQLRRFAWGVAFIHPRWTKPREARAFIFSESINPCRAEGTFFCHLKLELLTQFPASNDRKIFPFVKNIHKLNYFISSANLSYLFESGLKLHIYMGLAGQGSTFSLQDISKQSTNTLWSVIWRDCNV